MDLLVNTKVRLCRDPIDLRTDQVRGIINYYHPLPDSTPRPNFPLRSKLANPSPAAPTRACTMSAFCSTRLVSESQSYVGGVGRVGGVTLAPLSRRCPRRQRQRHLPPAKWTKMTLVTEHQRDTPPPLPLQRAALSNPGGRTRGVCVCVCVCFWPPVTKCVL